MIELAEVQQLRDEALIERVSTSVRMDRRLAVRMLVELGEVQARGLYRDLGYSSMFAFATRKLGMSESEAALRIRAAKAGRAVPDALAMLGRCEVHLTTLSLLAPVLHAGSLHLLFAARGKTKSEVQALIAAHAPKPDVPDCVRRLSPSRPPCAPRASARVQPVDRERVDATAEAPAPLREVHPCTNHLDPPQSNAGAVVQRSAAPAPPRDAHPCTNHLDAPQSNAGAVVQWSAERHKFSFTGSERMRALLRQAQDLRRHRYPAGDLEPLFERALELLVAEEKKRKFALTPKPRATTTTRAAEHSRYIPHHVRRQAWARSDGQCCFVAPDATRCQARSRLEFHHVVPFARGGPASADNIVLLCRAHNILHAERDYGRAFMRRRVEHRASGVSGDGPRSIREGHRPPLPARPATHQPQAP